VETFNQVLGERGWSMRVRIRDAVDGDLPQIVEIERLSFDNPWSRDSFLRELSLPFSRTSVAVTSNDVTDVVVGYLCRWLVADECHILNVAVRPIKRRIGVGERLMEHAIDEAKLEKARLVTLEVRRSNLAARSLYRKLGFEERRLRKNYYGSGDDAIVMELRVK
jgi:[ribosomal protein S18]-alanine N-acetyltransferase